MKNKILTFGFFVLLLILFSSSVFAEVEIKMNIQESFGLGETVSFDYTLTSDKSEKIQYLASANCPNVPMPLLDLREVDLVKEVPLKESYTFLDINENIEPQKCNASVTIISPYNNSITKEFLISTVPSFIFNVLINKKSFIKGEEINFSYQSNIDSLLIKAVLTYPDERKKEIKFPGEVKAEQIGSYSLEISASKEGYKTATEKVIFGVIEKPAEIKDAPFVGNITKDIDGNNNPWIIWLVSLIVILLILLLIYLKIRKKS